MSSIFSICSSYDGFGVADQLRDVAEMGDSRLVTDAVGSLSDDEPASRKVIYGVDRAARHRETFGQLVNVVGRVGRQQFHQPQQALEFGLVHMTLE